MGSTAAGPLPGCEPSPVQMVARGSRWNLVLSDPQDDDVGGWPSSRNRRQEPRVRSDEGWWMMRTTRKTVTRLFLSSQLICENPASSQPSSSRQSHARDLFQPRVLVVGAVCLAGLVRRMMLFRISRRRGQAAGGQVLFSWGQVSGGGRPSEGTTHSAQELQDVEVSTTGGRGGGTATGTTCNRALYAETRRAWGG